MVDLFFLIVVVIVIGFFGGLLYLIYLPFKSRLKKSGKLTDKLNRKINRLFVLSLSLICVVLYCFKDYRTSSKYRLEKVSDIKLPINFKVLKDEYQDMKKDYCIDYEIQLDNNSIKELIKGIKATKFFNSNINSNSGLSDSLFIRAGNEKGIWCKSEKGYRFIRQVGLTTYSIELDTLTRVLYYDECSN